MVKRFSLRLAVGIFLLLVVFNVVSAADNLSNAFTPGGPLQNSADKAGYDISKTDPNPVIGAVIQTFLSILGIIFLILMIYSGYSWMTAHGDEQKVTKAKETITAAIIGLVIVIGAYAITFLVISKLTAGTLK